jgi:hypothetical protein
LLLEEFGILDKAGSGSKMFRPDAEGDYTLTCCLFRFLPNYGLMRQMIAEQYVGTPTLCDVRQGSLPTGNKLDPDQSLIVKKRERYILKGDACIEKRWQFPHAKRDPNSQTLYSTS